MERKNNSPEMMKIRILDEQYHEYLLVKMLETHKKLEGYIPNEIIEEEEYETNKDMDDPCSEVSVIEVSNTLSGGIIGAFRRIASHQGLTVEYQSCYEIIANDSQLMEMRKNLSEKYRLDSIASAIPEIIVILRSIRDDENIFELQVENLIRENTNIDYLMPALFHMQEQGMVSNLQAFFGYRHTNLGYTDFSVRIQGKYLEKIDDATVTDNIHEKLETMLLEARKKNHYITFHPTKKDDTMIVEEKIYYDIDDIKLIDIPARHPYSTIHTFSHKGKLQGYEVMVKTELRKSKK